MASAQAWLETFIPPTLIPHPHPPDPLSPCLHQARDAYTGEASPNDRPQPLLGRRQSAPPNPVAVAAAAAATAAAHRRAATHGRDGRDGKAEGRPAGQVEGRPAGLAGSRTASELPGVTGQPTRTASELVAMGRKRPPPPPPGGPAPPRNGVSPRRAAAAAASAGLTFGASHDASSNGRRPLHDASRVEDLPLTRGAAKEWLAASVEEAERRVSTSQNTDVDVDDDGWSPNPRVNPPKAADDEGRKATEAAEATKRKAGEKEMLSQMRKSAALASLHEQQSRGGLTSAFFARRRQNSSQETITIPSAKDRRSLFS